jgi:hypothetical protein
MSSKRLKTLESRVAYRIARSKNNVFIRDDFKDLGGYDQVGRALSKMVAKQRLVKLGYGLYARTKESSVSGKMIPVQPLPELAIEALERLNIEVSQSSAEHLYNATQTEQVPTGRVIAVKDRVTRQIGYNGHYVRFERAKAA